jgi:outer membrane protein assembly factor BamB
MKARLITDDAIRVALTLDAEVRAPSDLLASIDAIIATAPQRRAWLWNPSRRFSLAIRLLAVALLLAALLWGIVFVGALRQQAIVMPAVTTFHGGPDRTGIMAGPGPEGTLSPCWAAYQLKGPVGSYAPAVSDGVVFVGDGGGWLTAVSEATGAVLWQVPVGGAVNSAPAIADGMVIVGSDDGSLHSFGVSSGATRWSYPTNGRVRSSPAVVDGVVYFGSDDGTLVALDVATGSKKWSVQTGGPVDRAVAIADGVVYAGSGSGVDATFDAYDARTGRALWPQPAHLGAGNTSTPAVAGSQVFVASGMDNGAIPHVLFALDSATGDEQWRFSSPVGVQEQLNVGALAGGVVYVGSFDDNMYGLDAGYGHPVWATPFVTQGQIGSVAGYVDGTLYLPSSDQHIYAIDTVTGRQRSAPFEVVGQPSGPAIVDGRLFVATTLGQLYCIQGSSNTSASTPGHLGDAPVTRP